MPQWKPEDEALFSELCRRAEQQSRDAALRAAPAPAPPPPSPTGTGRASAPAPPAAAGGAASHPTTQPPLLRRPTLDQETLLILVVLAFLIRCRADRELIWALLYILLF